MNRLFTSNNLENKIRSVRFGGILFKFVLFVGFSLLISFLASFYILLSLQEEQITENLKDKSLAVLKTLTIPVREFVKENYKFDNLRNMIVRQKTAPKKQMETLEKGKISIRLLENQMKELHWQLKDDMNIRDFYVIDKNEKLFTFAYYYRDRKETKLDAKNNFDHKMHQGRLSPELFYTLYKSDPKMTEFNRMRASLPIFDTNEDRDFYYQIYILFGQTNRSLKEKIFLQLLETKKWQKILKIVLPERPIIGEETKINEQRQYKELANNKLKKLDKKGSDNENNESKENLMDEYEQKLLVLRAMAHKTSVINLLEENFRYELFRRALQAKIIKLPYHFYSFFKNAKFNESTISKEKEFKWYTDQLVDEYARYTIDFSEWKKQYTAHYTLYRKSLQDISSAPLTPAQWLNKVKEAIWQKTKGRNSLSWLDLRDTMQRIISKEKIPLKKDFNKNDEWELFNKILQSVKKYIWIETPLTIQQLAITVKAHEQIGIMVLVMETEDYKKNVKVVSASITDIGISIILRVMVLSVLFAVMFTRRIRFLGEQTLAIGQGQLARNITVRGNDEIAQLADNINLMSQNLLIAQKQEKEMIRLETELKQAAEIQAALLPSCVDFPDLEHAAYYNAERLSGGDYYDYFRIGDRKIGWVIGDVSGHGVGAAMVMSMTRSLVREYSRRLEDPMTSLIGINEILVEDTEPHYFVTLFLAIIDPVKKEMQFSSGGHNQTIVIEPGNGVRKLTAGGMALGSFGGEIFSSMVQNHKHSIKDGEILLQYSDGVTEAMNAKREEYGEERLINLLKNISKEKNVSPDSVVTAIKKDLQDFVQNTPQSDDITITAIRIKAMA